MGGYNPNPVDDSIPAKTAAEAEAIAGAQVRFRGSYGGAEGAAFRKYNEMYEQQQKEQTPGTPENREYLKQEFQRRNAIIDMTRRNANSSAARTMAVEAEMRGERIDPYVKGKAVRQGYDGEVRTGSYEDSRSTVPIRENAPLPLYLSRGEGETVDTFVPQGRWEQMRIPESKVYATRYGEVGVYTREGGRNNSGRWVLASSGSPAALQSGRYTVNKPATAAVRTRESGGEKFDTTANVQEARLILASPENYARLGAEAYGGFVQPLDNRTVESSGAQLSKYSNQNNLANLVSPSAVNIQKSERVASGIEIPWNVSESSPAIQVEGIGVRIPNGDMQQVQVAQRPMQQQGTRESVSVAANLGTINGMTITSIQAAPKNLQKGDQHEFPYRKDVIYQPDGRIDLGFISPGLKTPPSHFVQFFQKPVIQESEYREDLPTGDIYTSKGAYTRMYIGDDNKPSPTWNIKSGGSPEATKLYGSFAGRESEINREKAVYESMLVGNVLNGQFTGSPAEFAKVQAQYEKTKGLSDTYNADVERYQKLEAENPTKITTYDLRKGFAVTSVTEGMSEQERFDDAFYGATRNFLPSKEDVVKSGYGFLRVPAGQVETFEQKNPMSKEFVRGAAGAYDWTVRHPTGFAIEYAAMYLTGGLFGGVKAAGAAGVARAARSTSPFWNTLGRRVSSPIARGAFGLVEFGVGGVIVAGAVGDVISQPTPEERGAKAFQTAVGFIAFGKGMQGVPKFEINNPYISPNEGLSYMSANVNGETIRAIRYGKFQPRDFGMIFGRRPDTHQAFVVIQTPKQTFSWQAPYSRPKGWYKPTGTGTGGRPTGGSPFGGGGGLPGGFGEVPTYDVTGMGAPRGGGVAVRNTPFELTPSASYTMLPSSVTGVAIGGSTPYLLSAPTAPITPSRFQLAQMRQAAPPSGYQAMISNMQVGTPIQLRTQQLSPDAFSESTPLGAAVDFSRNTYGETFGVIGINQRTGVQTTIFPLIVTKPGATQIHPPWDSVYAKTFDYQYENPDSVIVAVHGHGKANLPHSTKDRVTIPSEIPVGMSVVVGRDKTYTIQSQQLAEPLKVMSPVGQGNIVRGIRSRYKPGDVGKEYDGYAEWELAQTGKRVAEKTGAIYIIKKENPFQFAIEKYAENKGVRSRAYVPKPSVRDNFPEDAFDVLLKEYPSEPFPAEKSLKVIRKPTQSPTSVKPIEVLETKTGFTVEVYGTVPKSQRVGNEVYDKFFDRLTTQIVEKTNWGADEDKAWLTRRMVRNAVDTYDLHPDTNELYLIKKGSDVYGAATANVRLSAVDYIGGKGGGAGKTLMTVAESRLRDVFRFRSYEVQSHSGATGFYENKIGMVRQPRGENIYVKQIDPDAEYPFMLAKEKPEEPINLETIYSKPVKLGNLYSDPTWNPLKSPTLAKHYKYGGSSRSIDTPTDKVMVGILAERGTFTNVPSTLPRNQPLDTLPSKYPMLYRSGRSAPDVEAFIYSSDYAIGSTPYDASGWVVTPHINSAISKSGHANLVIPLKLRVAAKVATREDVTIAHRAWNELQEKQIDIAGDEGNFDKVTALISNKKTLSDQGRFAAGILGLDAMSILPSNAGEFVLFNRGQIVATEPKFDLISTKFNVFKKNAPTVKPFDKLASPRSGVTVLDKYSSKGYSQFNSIRPLDITIMRQTGNTIERIQSDTGTPQHMAKQDLLAETIITEIGELNWRTGRRTPAKARDARDMATYAVESWKGADGANLLISREPNQKLMGIMNYNIWRKEGHINFLGTRGGVGGELTHVALSNAIDEGATEMTLYPLDEEAQNYWEHMGFNMQPHGDNMIIYLDEGAVPKYAKRTSPNDTLDIILGRRPSPRIESMADRIAVRDRRTGLTILPGDKGEAFIKTLDIETGEFYWERATPGKERQINRRIQRDDSEVLDLGKERPVEPINKYITTSDIEISKSWGETHVVHKGEHSVLRGVITDRSAIPDTLYHVTTNIDAVKDDGVLRHIPKGVGLGKGSSVAHHGVSLTTSIDDARLIKRELTRVTELSHGVDFPTKFKDYIAEDESIAKQPIPIYEDMMDEYAFRIKRAKSEGYDVRNAGLEVLRSYRVTRDRITQGKLQDPIIFGMADTFEKTNPSSIGIVTVSKAVIPEDVVVRDPIGGFMHEVMVHSDVPISGTIQKVKPVEPKTHLSLTFEKYPATQKVPFEKVPSDRTLKKLEEKREGGWVDKAWDVGNHPIQHVGSDMVVAKTKSGKVVGVTISRYEHEFYQEIPHLRVYHQETYLKGTDTAKQMFKFIERDALARSDGRTVEVTATLPNRKVAKHYKGLIGYRGSGGQNFIYKDLTEENVIQKTRPAEPLTIQTIDTRDVIDFSKVPARKRPDNVATPAERAMIIRQFELTPEEIKQARHHKLSLNDILHNREYERMRKTALVTGGATGYAGGKMKPPANLADWNNMWGGKLARYKKVYGWQTDLSGRKGIYAWHDTGLKIGTDRRYREVSTYRVGQFPSSRTVPRTGLAQMPRTRSIVSPRLGRQTITSPGQLQTPYADTLTLQTPKQTPVTRPIEITRVDPVRIGSPGFYVPPIPIIPPLVIPWGGSGGSGGGGGGRGGRYPHQEVIPIVSQLW